jgi:hypothetical protein
MALWVILGPYNKQFQLIPLLVPERPRRPLIANRRRRGSSTSVLRIMGLREVVWVFLATSERWKHACEHLEPQIFLVA